MIDSSLREEAIGLTRDLLRVDTSNPPGNETPAAMLLKDYLESNGLECELVARDPDRANLVTRIRGTGDGPSLALLGHTDVVPADAQDWTHPPFGGHLDEDGYVWGRGAVDMKNETATRAVAMAALAREGFTPRGDLVFIAQADEEDGEFGVGLQWLVKERPDLRTDYAIDEGGGTRQELVDGRAVVTLDIGQKATLGTLVTALGEAGHASTPTAGANAVPRLATLIQRVASHRTRRRLLPVTRAMLETLIGDFDEADLDDAITRAVALHPTFADLIPALFGITIAPTRLHGSTALNVMPGRASVGLDCRLLPGDTQADLDRELREALGDDLPYEIEYLEDPPTGGTVANADTPLFGVIQRLLDEHDPGAILLPTISTGFTDSHWVRQAWGTDSYGFWPMRHTPLDVYINGIHNKDERIHADDLAYGLEFTLYAARAVGAMSR